MLKRIGLAVLAIVFFLGAKEVKLAYIDSNRVFKEYQSAIDAKKALDQELVRWQEQARTFQLAADSARAQYDAQKLMLSDQARAVKEEELRSLQTKYESFVQEVWGEGGKLEQKRLETTMPLVNKIYASVQKIAEAEGYTMIFDLAEGQVAYAATGLDLTDRVLEDLNREFKPVTPVTQAKPRTIVFALVDQGSDASALKLGETCRQLLYAMVGQSVEKQRLEQVSNTDVENRLRQLSVARGVGAQEAVSIASDLNARLAFFGAVEKRGYEVVVRLTLTDVRSSKSLTEEGTASDQKFLQETLAGLYQKLLKDMGL